MRDEKRIGGYHNKVVKNKSKRCKIRDRSDNDSCTTITAMELSEGMHACPNDETFFEILNLLAKDGKAKILQHYVRNWGSRLSMKGYIRGDKK